jgi:hypothetical protein
VRTQNNANEFAHYEYGAALAGNRMLKAVQALEPGKTELEIGALMHGDGQHHSVVTIMASGPRFVKANLYPTEHEITLGEPLSMTVGYKGGLQSHSGFAARDENDLPENQKDYVEQSAKPYYQAVVTWLETIKPGITGKQLYDAVNEVLPKEKYHWTLNPGHLCADEEWLSSPVYPDSEEVLKSGMLFQIDILPSVKGYNSANCESGIFLADEQLRKEIEKQYPDVWERVQNRRAWMQEELGIQLDASVLPTSCITAWLPPYLLDPARAMKQK